MRRRHDAFTTNLANHLAALTADAREAERAEHVGRMPDANAILVDIDRKLHAVVATVTKEMDVRQLTPLYAEMRGKPCS